MSRALTVEFAKMHGAGNDFVVLDNRWYRFSDDELSALAADWCRRRYGVGADGLLALADTDGDAAYRMRYVNADGSWATMCGNGARCLARFAVRAGMEGPDLAFDTDAGRYYAHVPPGDDAPVRLYVPEATRLALNFGLDGSLPDGLDAAHFVHTGTEHLVAFVDDLEAVPVERWGRQLRRDAALGGPGANVNFVTVGDGELRVRTYEKGVEAETLSCGTGVLAAAAVAQAADRVGGGDTTVRTPGGVFAVGRAQTVRGEASYLEGPVATVFRGTLTVD